MLRLGETNHTEMGLPQSWVRENDPVLVDCLKYGMLPVRCSWQCPETRKERQEGIRQLEKENPKCRGHTAGPLVIVWALPAPKWRRLTYR